MSDPVRCACPRRDATDCANFRDGLDLRAMFGEYEVEDADPCECVCHDDDEDDLSFAYETFETDEDGVPW